MMSWVSRIVNVFRPGRAHAELEEEMAFHLEQRVESLMAEGSGRAEAERAARRRMGNLAGLREESYEAKSAVRLDAVVRDVRFGLRVLRKHRTTTAAAVVSLGLAIGACTAAFTLIDALLLRPLPLPEPGRLVQLGRLMPAFLSPWNKAAESDTFSYPQFELFREAVRGEADLVALELRGGLQPVKFDDAGGVSEIVRIDAVSEGGFGVLRVRAAAGRLDGGAVVSDEFAKRRFGGNAIGRWVSVGREQFPVVGVAAFGGLQPGYLTDVWLPLKGQADPDAGRYQVWGRLREGVRVSRPTPLRKRPPSGRR
ncbi:MAG: ABC transporter permease [Bryobacteraceae bacterium]|nr:ABC transporter permease [Bryobacteraceae bacterium]